MKIISPLINTVLFHLGSLFGRVFRNDYFAKARNGKKVSERTLLKIVNENKNTEYGKKYGFSEIKTIEDYQRKVPLSLYEDYMDYIERSKNGELNLLTKKKIKSYAKTSGTTGIQKYIPQSSSTLVNYFKVIMIILNQCLDALRLRNVSTFNVRGFCNTEVTENRKSESDEYATSMASGVAANSVKYFIPLFTQLPADVIGCGELEDREYVKSRYALQMKDIKFICGVFMSSISFSIDYIEKNLEMLIEDIEKGTINPSIKMSDSIRNKLVSKLKPDPVRAAELREIMNNPSDMPFISRLWPELSFISAIGTGDFEPFSKAIINKCCKDVTINHSVYAASESLIAFAIKPNEASYLPLVDSGFYEFIPVDEQTDKVLLMSELEVGKLYEIVVTNKAGFYRYRLRDVIRVVDFEGETPLIKFAYRANVVTNICGTHITNEDISTIVKKLEKDFDLTAVDYSIYPNMDPSNSHIKFFIEFDKEVDESTVKSLEVAFEKYLQMNNTAYAHNILAQQIKPSELYVLKKNSYYNFRDNQIAHGASANQLKAMRLIKDEKTMEYFRSCAL